ncbi:hypothetical protein BH11ACT8_BH11ACT8_24390 [soil metagenome]
MLTSTTALRRALVALAVATLTTALLIAPSGDAVARGKHHKRVADWAPAASATITPGVMMYTKGAQCTANFVFTDARGDVYVGYAAHCAGKGSSTDTNGCKVDSLPLGTPVSFVEGGSVVSGGTRLGSGTLAYSSWLTEAELGTSDGPTCAYNDLALVRVAAKDVRKVNPSVPFWGGPTGIDRNGTKAGDRVYSYGNSSLRAGVSVLSPKLGLGLGDAAADKGWSHPVYTVTPGIPGDSGSGFMSGGGQAVGTLSTVVIAPVPLSNQIGDLAKKLSFARAPSVLRCLQLARGTEKFSGVL